MKLAISIVILAFASNFIWLVICADSSKKVAKKSLNSAMDSISNSNSTDDLKNATLSKNGDKNNSTLNIEKGKNSTTKDSSPMSDRKTASNKTDAMLGNKPMKSTLNESANNKTGSSKLESDRVSGMNASGGIPGK